MQRTLVKRAAEVELEVVKSEHRIAIANLKEQHELELQNVKKEGERIVTKLKRDMQKEIETAKQAAAGYLDERDENRRRLDAVEARNDQLEKQLNQSQR
jgi:membrane peptidoglycan carboxypeptidase